MRNRRSRAILLPWIGAGGTLLRRHIIFAGALVSLSCGPASAADVKAGSAKAQPCLVCHGAGAVSETPGVPTLSGQTDRYIEWQLVNFRGGRRENEIMQPIAAELSDDDIRNLGAFIASLPTPAARPLPDADSALSEMGRSLIERRHCNVCHNDNLHGIQAAPRIAPQDEAYTAKVLDDYRSDRRLSPGAGAMNDAVGGLTDDNIKALAHYLAHAP